jgi:hypothetical protein
MPPQFGTFRLVSSPSYTSTRGYPAEYKDWTTNAARACNCVRRRLDGFRHTPEAFRAIQEAIRTYERATGACLNPRKSKALAVGAWTERPTLLGIDLHKRFEILGVEFGPTVALSIRDSWSRVTSAVRAQARRAYARHVLGKGSAIRAAVPFRKEMVCCPGMPSPQVQAQQLTTICSWYLWQGATFRVPMTTLHRPKHEGGWGLPHVAIK